MSEISTKMSWKKFSRKLKEPVPLEIKQDLGIHRVEFEEAFNNFLTPYFGAIAYLDKEIDDIIEQARVGLYQRENVYLKAQSTCCDKGESCSTCLGYLYLHYPYLEISDRNADPKKRKWKQVRKRIEREFLSSRCGLHDKIIERFYAVIDIRETLIQLYHTMIRYFYHIGLVSKTVGSGE